MQIFAILGSHPNLSLAEIKAVTGVTPETSAGVVAIFDTLDTDLPVLMDTLGGVQKFGVVIGEVQSAEPEEIIAFLASQLEHEFRESKMHFGISAYDFGHPRGVDKIAKQTKTIGMTVKTRLKEKNRPSRYVMSQEAALNAVAVRKNELIKKGAEFVFMVANNRIVIGTTSAVQDAEDWSERDFGRPRRNAKQGMLPPKLARMMLNMTGKRIAGATVLDPFCGSGTVLMEAAMLGAAKVIGSDIATVAVHDTQHNMAWLKERGQGVAVSDVDVFAAKASEVGDRLSHGSVDVIVTETYLGLPRKGVETAEDLKKAVDYITTLYQESFSTMRNVLNKDGVLLVAAPVHMLGKESFEADVVQILETLGYWHDPIGPEQLIYHREDQMVGRHFFRFRKLEPRQGGADNAAITKKMLAE